MHVTIQGMGTNHVNLCNIIQDMHINMCILIKVANNCGILQLQVTYVCVASTVCS